MTLSLTRSVSPVLVLLAACTVHHHPGPAAEPVPPEPAGEEPVAGYSSGSEPDPADELEPSDPPDAALSGAAVDLEVAGAQLAVAGAEVEASAGSLEPSAPIACSGSQDVRLVDRSIETGADAVLVSGSCDVLIERSTIRAGRVAIAVSGSGEVVIRNSVIEGRMAALAISGSGSVRAEKTRFAGRRLVSGNGDYIDGGGNRWGKR